MILNSGVEKWDDDFGNVYAEERAAIPRERSVSQLSESAQTSNATTPSGDIDE